ncbi:dephospho-CoA kinase [Chloroflexota bacterium]
MLIIGVTGNFGTGKTTVCEILAQLGATVINADGLGHELLERSNSAYSELAAAFGETILTADKEIDRSKLAEAAFKDRDAQAQLNKIMHPRLYRIVKDIVAQYRRRGDKVIALEAALLIEAGWKPLVDQLWVTVAPELVLLERLKAQRGFSDEQIIARLRTQMPMAEKAAHADVVIDTDCSREELKAKVTALWQKLKSSSGE